MLKKNNYVICLISTCVLFPPVCWCFENTLSTKKLPKETMAPRTTLLPGVRHEVAESSCSLSKVKAVAAGHLPCYTPATKASMVDCTSEETDTSFI